MAPSTLQQQRQQQQRQQQRGPSRSLGHRSPLAQQPCWPGQQRGQTVLVAAQQQPDGPPTQPQPFDDLPPPPPPPPPSAFGGSSSATPRFQDLSWREFKERYLRPNYLQGSFVLGALTLGLRVSAANYTLENNPFEFFATAASTGLMCTALAWVLFDFTDSPPPGGNFSSPRK